jgi:uncharacterized protein with FMN-binding domain
VNPVKHNLVALGSAAVLAVYSAGYLRTKSAADRFLVDDAERHRIVATTEPAPNPAPFRTDTNPGPAAAAPARSGDTIKPPVPTAAVAPAAKKKVSPKVTDPAPAPHTIATAPVPGSQDSASLGQTGDSATQPSGKEHGQYKDGRYSGWGTSRHGDIEATVEIQNGHITSAWISQCYTRYSCSWIAALPPQVVTRQSANVDYVSGATQSTNAFYYAVVEALAKAK